MAKLLKHQIEFFNWWSSVDRRGLGALGMGLGKTYLGAYICYKNLEAKKYKNILIVTLSSIIPKWKEELDKLQVPYLHWGTPGDELNIKPYVVNLVSFESIQRKRTKGFSKEDLKKFKNKPLLDQLTKRFVKGMYDLIIADESHFLNNTQSINYRTFQKIITKDTHLLFLSGTPFSNGLHDSFAQMNLISPGLLGGNLTIFREAFLENVSRSPKYVTWKVKETKEEILKKLIYKKAYFKDIVDGINLPPLTISNYPYELSAEQRSLYQHILRKKVYPEKTEFTPEGIPIDTAPRACNLLRTICSGFVKFDFEFPSIPTQEIRKDFGKIPKEELLLYAAEKLKGEQALIWINFIETGNRIYKLLKEAGYKVGLINGKVDKAEREIIIRNFRANNVQIIVAHPKTLGTGLDLIEARKQFFYEPSYSLTEYEQALKRSHRIGQEHPVIIFRFVCRESIDNAILKALDNKQDVETFLFKDYLKEFKNVL